MSWSQPEPERYEPWSITLPILNAKLESINSIEDAAVGEVLYDGGVYKVFFMYIGHQKYFIKLTNLDDQSIIRHRSKKQEALVDFMKEVERKL